MFEYPTRFVRAGDADIHGVAFEDANKPEGYAFWYLSHRMFVSCVSGFSILAAPEDLN